MPTIVLASKSPRRQELLRHMGIENFTVCSPDAEEWYPPELSAQEIVQYISREKADAARTITAADDIVITADTMVFLGDKRLGKPHSEDEALAMLTALQGTHHIVCTGVTVRQGDKAVTFAETTKVFFRTATREELLGYIRTGEPMDKAGAYGVQGLGALLVEAIEGDYYNVVGLPIMRLSRVLEEFGVSFFA